MKPQSKLSIEKSTEGKKGVALPELCKEASKFLPENLMRKEKPVLPEMSEFEVVRHFTNLSRKNYSLDTHFYPLGSCTMKYNPRAYEAAAAEPSFSSAHPFADANLAQGTLELMYNLERGLSEICGFHSFTLQPAAGAHGEWTGVLIAKAYHAKNNDLNRTEVIVPDTAHGTNPATANMAGLKVVNIKSGADGCVDLEALKEVLGPKTALVMLTVPNTAGLFEKDIKEIADMVHDAGSLLYMDGANFNALIGLAKPGEIGADILHLNLHKTFSTPHGGGGPGSGAVGVAEHLAEFLPGPIVVKNEKTGFFTLACPGPLSIGRVKAFYGNIAVLVKTYCYIKQHDGDTLKEIAQNAILNANYIKEKLKDFYPSFFDSVCMHECVLTINKEKFKNVKTLDVAKRLLDYGFYAPTIYFPLIVPEAMMIEPTETESKNTIDRFADAMISIYEEAVKTPELVTNAPQTQPVKRIDEVSAAREPNLRW
ncbi:aminomethyl-transferring glycine dehydrogenase subunit GcvPB [Elusimicrobium minutum]|uniref:aminomethyl-transferring glycine dehydrogenase subunit GcvPB n=1 Tax=Elusimicrobium minutum TaxID=423605 RepID=UPI00059F7E9E